MGDGIRVGNGEEISREELIAFLDKVFGFDGKERSFAILYPHIYGEGTSPGERNLVVTENGKLVAAAGRFYRTLIAGDRQLKLCGIGNVAVHPDHRGRGFMKLMMNTLLGEMQRAGADLSDLGGQRQRYAYFGYETAGAPVSFRFTPRTAGHLFRDRAEKDIAFLPLREGEREDLWDRAYALYGQKRCRILRSREDFPGILRSHVRQPYAILEGERFRGYFTGELGELTLEDPADLADVVRVYTARNGEVVFPVGPWEKALLEEASVLAEETILAYRAKLNVFRYRKTVGAFLDLKSGQERLADGEMTLLIHGFAGDETLHISVSGGVPAVEEAAPGKRPDAEFGHREAIRFFFGVYSPEREKIPLSRDWFPLPFAVERADHV